MVAISENPKRKKTRMAQLASAPKQVKERRNTSLMIVKRERKNVNAIIFKGVRGTPETVDRIRQTRSRKKEG